jgi:subtilisin family serine protease
MILFTGKSYLLSFLVVFLLIIKSISFGQQNISIKNNSIPVNKPGIVISSISKHDSIIAKFTLDLNEEINVIIQLKETPVSLLKSISSDEKYALTANAISLINIEHSKFKSDLSKIENMIPNNQKSLAWIANSKINFEYRTAVNAFALTTKRWVIEEIKKLPYVKSVYEDVKVKTDDAASNHLIGADSVWSKLGLTGKGIVIGVLDTGVDYTHPDLGGGIGAGFKVIGGYDFVNNDNDPMDDYGHGTHVAGIAAANGSSLKGAAPDAKIYAIKVLDAKGNGLSSTIIAGIEKAMDPDNNPYTKDAVNVLNMSFTGPGNPNDLLAQSVNNASNDGIVCVVAAGNTGPGYGSIGSPACALTALTVGAVNNYDQIASFSSRGPTDMPCLIKPDIVAPGVEIISTKAGGGYVSHDGTSMAAPHVAGCAALILQKHPEWKPEIIKAALMESAKDLKQNTWIQGGGRVDIFKALKKDIVVSPASLSLGSAIDGGTAYTRRDTILIYNYSSVQKSYNFSLEQNFPAGLNVNINPVSLVIDPAGSKKIIVTSVIDNTKLPYAASIPGAYSGKIKAISMTDTIIVPVALIKSPGVVINFDENPWIVYLFNKSGMYSYVDPGTTLTKMIPTGIYQMHVVYHDVATHIIMEDVSINSVTGLRINKSAAKNKINILSYSEKDSSVQILVGYELFGHKPSTYDVWFSGAFHPDKYFNDFSSNYLWDWQATTNLNSKKFYSFNGYLNNGCNSDITMKNDPASFKHIRCHFNMKPGVKDIIPFYLLGHALMGFDRIEALKYPFIQDVYLTPVTFKGFEENHVIGSPYFFESFYQDDGTSFFYYNNLILLQSPWMYIRSRDTVEICHRDNSKNEIFTGTDCYFGYGVPHWSGKMNNLSSTINLFGGNEVYTNNLAAANITNYFYYPNNDWIPLPDLKYYLSKGTKLLQNGSISDQPNLSLPITPDNYTFQVSTDHYYIQGRKGIASVILNFDSRKKNPNPPFIESLKILADGIITDQLNSTQKGEVKFSVTDLVSINNVCLQYHSESDSVWRNIAFSKGNSLYSADIPLKIPDEFISLRITASNNVDNTLEYKLEPAFKMNGVNHSPVITSITNLTAKVDSLFEAQVTANDPDNDALIYSLETNHEWLSIDSLNGKLSGRPSLKDILNNNFIVRITDDKGGSVSKQFTINILHTNHLPSSFYLVSPKDRDTLHLCNPPVPIKFTWNSAKDIDYFDSLRYTFRLKGTGLDTLISQIKDTVLQVNFMPLLSAGRNYSWSVDVTDGTELTASNDTFLLVTSGNISETETVGNDNLPKEFSLSQNYPNPFNGTTIINYSIPNTSAVILKVYDILGNETAILTSEVKSPGNYRVKFPNGNCSSLASGIYFVQMKAGGFVSTKKIILLK